MACPTCGEIQDGVGEVPAIGGDATFWCPRCGTLEMHTDGVSAFKVPKLVEQPSERPSDHLAPDPE